MTKLVKRAQPEVKEIRYPYTNLGSTTFASIGYGGLAPVGSFMTGITKGVNDGQRIGNRIKAIGIRINLAVQPGDNYDNVRFVMFKPKTSRYQNSSGATFVQSIFSGNAGSGTQWLQPVDTDRYKVYFDKIMNLKFMPTDGASATSIPQTKFLRRFVKIRMNVQWDDQDSLLQDVYFVAISDSAAVPNPGVVAGFFQVYYTDA